MAPRNTSPTSIASAVSGSTAEAGAQSASRSTASPLMSTPPTSLGDESSVLSDVAKMEVNIETNVEIPPSPTVSDTPVAAQSTPTAPSSEGRRPPRASRASVTTYNVQILAGTAIHTPTKYLEKHHGNVLHGPLESVLKTNLTPPRRRGIKVDPEDISDPAEAQLATEAAQAAQRRTSSRVDLRKEVTRRNLTAAAGGLAQRGSELISSVGSKVGNALGVSGARSRGAGGSSARAGKSEDDDTEQEEEKEYLKPKTKEWMKQGLYVGQHREFDPRLKESQNRLRRKSKKVEESKIIPLPMFSGERMLTGEYRRDFKLPFDVYHPLPRKVKVDGWIKLQKNRFIGDASALWKRDKQDSSSCYCTPEDGCGEDCHNRIMAYECDENNCRLTPEQCGNRPFAQLKVRAKGNGYDYGVEVMETGDKGYGVRAMRTFEPHQIIVEYAGEIITQEECERRMKQVYKRDKCYYLMSFDNKMIIDATRGTIARFVNHSCEPNCEMIKWTVGGEPRMALFAGASGIMTGEELTYDYNFDPFSLKNIQECRCGTKRCRGVLGPKPKHQPREEKSMASTFLAGTKRKLQEVFGSGSGSHSDPPSPKKRKLTVMQHAAITKKENARAQENAAREKANKEAAELAAQRASRENRAMRRTSSMTFSARKGKIVQKSVHRSTPALVSTRHTTVSLKRGTPRSLPTPAALKAGNTKLTRKSTSEASLQTRSLPTPKGKKRLASRSPSPARSPSPDSDGSPNITPASLRSATRKQLHQTKLPFKPLSIGSNLRKSDTLENYEVPDSEDEDYEEFASTAKRAKTNSGKARTARGTFKSTLDKSVRGTKRAAGVARATASAGIKGMGSLRDGGGKGTARKSTGVKG